MSYAVASHVTPLLSGQYIALKKFKESKSWGGMARMRTQDFSTQDTQCFSSLSSELCHSLPYLPSKAQEARLSWGSRRHCPHCKLNRNGSFFLEKRLNDLKTKSHIGALLPRTCGQVTGRLLKASGKMEDRASQALAWRVGCSELCRARGKGPFNIAVQNITTWNGGTVRTPAQYSQWNPLNALPIRCSFGDETFC